jgi:hypothetical protein
MLVSVLQDDFSATEDRVPTLLLGAVSGILECCNEAITNSHDVIVKLSISSGKRRSWRTDTSITNVKERLKTARSSLDLALDHVSL